MIMAVVVLVVSRKTVFIVLMSLLSLVVMEAVMEGQPLTSAVATDTSAVAAISATADMAMIVGQFVRPFAGPVWYSPRVLAPGRLC